MQPKPGENGTLKNGNWKMTRIRPAQPGGIFGVYAFATQPRIPMPHPTEVRGAFRGFRSSVKI
jgi:hypothetical protein